MAALLIVSVVSSGVFSMLAQKGYGRKEAGSGTFFTLVSALFTLVFFLIKAKFHIAFEMPTLIAGLVCGVCQIGAVVGLVDAIACGPLSLSGLFVKFAAAAPVIYGMFVLKEPLGKYTLLGITLCAVSIILSNCVKGDRRPNKKWWFFITVSVVSNCVYSTVLKAFQVKTGGEAGDSFIIITLSTAIIILLIYELVFERSAIKKAVRYFYYPALHGTFSGVSSMCGLWLAVLVPASFEYPTEIASSIAVTSIISVVAYKEKLKFAQWCAIAVGVAATILLSI